MPTLTLAKTDHHTSTPAYCYRVTDLSWCTSQPIDLLAAFLKAPGSQSQEPLKGFRFNDGTSECATKGLLVGIQRTVQARYQENRCLLAIEGIGKFDVEPDQIIYPTADCSTTASTIHEALLGPPLILALACRRRFVLHASAVQLGNQTWLFLGDSGIGKSTLAAYIASQPYCQRIADDLVPIYWQKGHLWTLPKYPQLKLDNQGQPRAGEIPEKLITSGIYQLQPVSATDAVTIKPLSHHEAFTALVQQTVAARLFSPLLLNAHFDTFAQITETIPIYQLNVPRHLDRLEETCQALCQAAATKP